jgi:hypothetical protein
MAALSRRIIPALALALACGLAATAADGRPGSSNAEDGEGTQSVIAQPCIVGHRFEPGPILDGHNRQPTRAEFEARTRQLRAFIESCSTAPLSSKAGGLNRLRPASKAAMKVLFAIDAHQHAAVGAAVAQPMVRGSHANVL